jgi:YD repeat-containing protein
MAAIRPAANANDQWTWMVYDAEDRLLQTIDGSGAVVTNAYDASGQLVSTTETSRRLTAAQVQALKSNPPTAPVQPSSGSLDRITRIFYDAAGLVVGRMDGDGYLTTMAYDAAGQKVAETSYFNPTRTADRTDGTLETLLAGFYRSSNDRTTNWVYDAQGLLRFVVDPLNHVVEYSYFPESRVIMPGDDSGPGDSGTAFGRVTTSYAGAIAAQQRYTMASVRSALDALDLNGAGANRKSYEVEDRNGRVAFAIATDGAVTHFDYDIMGQVVATTRFATKRPTAAMPNVDDMESWASANAVPAQDRITRNSYDETGRLIETIDPEGYRTRYEYDAGGRLVATLRYSQRFAAGNGTGTVSYGPYVATTYAYDVLDRLIGMTAPNGVAHSYTYAANGLMEFDIVAAGTADERRTRFEYDGAGRVVTTYAAWDRPEQTVTRTSYTAFGEAATETDALGRVTSYNYNRRGQVVGRTDAAGGTMGYTYSGFGELVKTTDARGNASYRYFDLDGQLVAERDAEDYVTQYSYTVFGEIATSTRRYNRATNTADLKNLPAVADNTKDATTAFTYDRLGRVVTTTDAEGFAETSTYDAFGNVTQVTNKLGGIVDYGYDRRGLLVREYVRAAVHNGAGTQVATGYVRHAYTYDSRGNRLTDTEAQGLAEQRVTRFAYDAVDRLTERRSDAVSVGFAGGTATPTETYSYDARDNLILTVDAAGARTQRWYDKLDRVVAEAVSFGGAERHADLQQLRRQRQSDGGARL